MRNTTLFFLLGIASGSTTDLTARSTLPLARFIHGSAGLREIRPSTQPPMKAKVASTCSQETNPVRPDHSLSKLEKGMYGTIAWALSSCYKATCMWLFYTHAIPSAKKRLEKLKVHCHDSVKNDEFYMVL